MRRVVPKPFPRVRAFWIVLLLGLILFSSRSLWLPGFGHFLVVSDPLEPAQVIVPLAGGSARAVYAAELYRQGYARFFLATDMPLDVPGVRESYSELVAREVQARGVPPAALERLTQTARTTQQEARAVLALTREKGWKSLLVVTSAYHTRRARWIFSQVFAGSGVEVRVVPVAGDAYRPETWWQSNEGLRDTWTEYLKMVLHGLGYE